MKVRDELRHVMIPLKPTGVIPAGSGHYTLPILSGRGIP